MATLTRHLLTPTLHRRFPVGTSVGIYPANARGANGSATGSPVTTMTVAAAGNYVSGLEPGKGYVAYAKVNDQHRYVGFHAEDTHDPDTGFDPLLEINTEYFVATSGSDSNTGLGPNEAVATVTAAMSKATRTGDRVVLNRGDRFYETMTIPRAGLTIGAYGDPPVQDADGYITNAPVIDGGVFVTGWSSYSGGDETRVWVSGFTGTAGTNLTAHTPTVGSALIKNDVVAGDIVITDANRARRNAASTVPLYVTQDLANEDYYAETDIFIGTTITDFAGPIVRTFNYKDTGYRFLLGRASGSLTLAKVVAGTVTTLTPTPALVALTLADGESYTLRIEVEGSTVRGKVKVAGAGTWAQEVEVTDTSIPDGDRAGIKMGSASAGAASNTAGLHVDRFEVGSLGAVGSPVDTYKASRATATYVVDVKGELATLGSNSDQLAEGQFFWGNSSLYVRSSTGVPSDTDVVVGSLQYGVNIGTHADTTIKGVAFEHQNSRAINAATGAHRFVLDEVMVQKSGNATPNTQNGVVGIDGANSWTATRCVIRNCYNDGIYGQNTSGMTVEDCRIGPVHGFGSDGIHIDGSGSVSGIFRRNWISMRGSTAPKGCLILFGNSYTVEYNQFEGSGDSAPLGTGNYGVSMVGSGNTVVHNAFIEIPNDAIRATSNGDNAPQSNYTIENNICIDCGMGIDIRIPATNFNIHHNTLVNKNRSPQFADADDYLLRVLFTITGSVESNIVWDASGGERAVKFDVIPTALIRENVVGPEGTDFYSVNGTGYATLAALVAAVSKERGSVASDPQFVNLGGLEPSDYRTRWASASRGKGAPLGSV